MRPAVFLDRDDTLIRCREVAPDGDLGDPALVELKPGVRDGCRRLKDAGFALVVITNQGGVARGKYTLDDVDRVNARLNDLLGGVIDAFRACPYHPGGVVPEYTREHPWRKPQPGMILDAAEKLGLDLSQSWVIGDAMRDCEAGKAAGCRAILIGSGAAGVAADHVASDFDGAVRTILAHRSSSEARGGRVLVVAPTWVGDVVMATPAFRALRDGLPGRFLCALVKPGIHELLAGTDFFDELIVDSREGVMGVKRAASKVRQMRCDTAILLTNSFSTALLARLAGVPRRIGYGRDGRSMLLTDSLSAPRRVDTTPFNQSTMSARTWAPIPACDYYLELVRRALGRPDLRLTSLELGISEAQRDAGEALLSRAGVAERAFAVLNPGGNNPAKRWPAERFAQLATWLESERGLAVVVSGAPSERAIAESIVQSAQLPPERSLPSLGVSLGSLKRVLERASLLVTNDTGPRHIAAAFGTPVVTLFGPTDPRWTTIPFDAEAIVVADPTLPACEVAEDHPERCRIERIEMGAVIDAVNAVLPATTIV